MVLARIGYRPACGEATFLADLERIKRLEWTPAPRIRSPQDALHFMAKPLQSGTAFSGGDDLAHP